MRQAGRVARPKIDANRSAAARFAVTFLAEHLTPEEVVAELAARAPKQTKTGRKRL